MSETQYGLRRPGYYGAYGNTPDPPSRPFPTETEAHALAEKYDIRHLSRNAYSLLLCELRSAGYITTQEFSAGYGGTLPHGAAAEPFPLGENEADFAALLGEYTALCEAILRNSPAGGMEHVHIRSLLDTYSRLSALFRQIRDAASGAGQETNNE